MATRSTRRQFVQAAVLSAASVAPALHLSAQQPPSQRVRLGLIGCGGRGRELLRVLNEHPDVEIVAVSDLIEPRMAEAVRGLDAAGHRSRPDMHVEHERLLERRDLDGVLIATTQHWHGIPFIQAALAGKHVFVEKPLSHTVVEGRAMVRAAAKTGVIALMGTQQRGYPHYLAARQLLTSGQLGKVALVECWNCENSGKRVGRDTDTQPPAGYHWDRWLGPAPWAPFNPSRLRHAWWFDYSGGMLTNWAIHHLDIILWFLKSPAPSLVCCAGGKLVVDDLADTPDTVEASWVFPECVVHYTYRGFNAFRPVQHRRNSHGICFFGTEATLILDRNGYELVANHGKGEVLARSDNPRVYGDGQPGNEVDGPWQRLFVDCIKERRQPPAELEASHRATTCCHLANIAYLTGRSVCWDGQQETIPGDAEAVQLLSRPRRPGYELPAV